MPVPTSKNSTPRVLLREVVFDRLLDAIVTGELAPGEVLKDAEIEQWSGASRTPVREAIERLGSLGFIDILPQKETRVAPIDFPRFADRLETFQALCVGTIPDAIPLLEDPDVEEITEQIDLLRRPGGAAADTPVIISDLFPSILRVYGNTVTLRIQESLLPHIRRDINARADDETYYMSEHELDRLDAGVRAHDTPAELDVVDEYFVRLVTHVRASIVATGRD